MKRHEIEYTAYKVLLESKIPAHKRNALIEASFLQKIASFFGAGKDTLTADIRKIFNDRKLGRRSAQAKQNIEKELDELKSIAQAAGVSEDSVYDILHLILKEKGMKPAEVAAAPGAGGGGSQGGAGGSAQQGAGGGPVVVTPQALAQNPQVAAPLLAAATGQPVAAVAAQVDDKKPSAAAITSALARATAKETGVDEKVATKAIQALVKSGELTLETRRRYRTLQRVEQPLIFERWQKLAGMPRHLLVEGDAINRWMAMVDNGDFKSVEDLQKAFEEKMGTSGFSKLSPGQQKKVISKLEEKLKGDGADAPAGDPGKQGGGEAPPDKDSSSADVAAAAQELDVAKAEAEKFKKQAEELAAELQNNKNGYKLFREKILQGLKIDGAKFDELAEDNGIEAVVASLMAQNAKAVQQAAAAAGAKPAAPDAGPQPGGTPAAAPGGSKAETYSKVIRGAIPPEELDDEALTKLSKYIEVLTKKAEDAAEELKKENK